MLNRKRWTVPVKVKSAQYKIWWFDGPGLPIGRDYSNRKTAMTAYRKAVSNPKTVRVELFTRPNSNTEYTSMCCWMPET